jgi:hypothetical protein
MRTSQPRTPFGICVACETKRTALPRSPVPLMAMARSIRASAWPSGSPSSSAMASDRRAWSRASGTRLRLASVTDRPPRHNASSRDGPRSAMASQTAVK